jgi:hypothetical protein
MSVRAIQQTLEYFKKIGIQLISWLMQLPERKKLARERHVKEFYNFAGTDQIALSDQLSSAWEYHFLKRMRFIFPAKSFRKSSNVLVEKFLAIKFLNQYTQKQQEENDINLAFLRYHSIQLNYGVIRIAIQPIAWMTIITLLLIPISYIAGIIFSLSGAISNPDETSIGINYKVASTGKYYLAVRSEDVSAYALGIQSQDIDASSPYSSKGAIAPVDFGQSVFGTVTYSNSQFIYEIYGKTGQTIYVTPFYGYIDVDIKFQILDSNMAPCSEVAIITVHPPIQTTSITCPILQDGNYYVSVKSDHKAEILSTGYFGFSINSIENQTEPNDSKAESYIIATGKFVKGEVSKSDQDWYVFSATKNDNLTIYSDPQERKSFSLTLYQDAPEGLKAVAYSTQGVEWKNAVRSRILETPSTRTVLYSVLLRPFGLDPSKEWLIANDLMIMAGLEILAISLCMLLFNGYFKLDWALSNRRYHNSLIVSAFLNILASLDDEDALQSEAKKASLREKIKRIANLIPSLSKISHSPWARPPRSISREIDKIASLVLQTNEAVTLPNKNTLSDLRKKFTIWLDLFMREEFGSIKFPEEKNLRPLPWYNSFVSTVQNHWLKGLAIGVISLILLFSVAEKSPQLAENIANFVWGIIRYVLLIGIVMAIYLQWGPDEYSNNPAPRWQNTVRFVLFFLVPFIVLDTILDTRIVTTLASLASSIKIF